MKPYILTVLALPPSAKPLGQTYILRKTYIDLLASVQTVPFGIPSSMPLESIEELYALASGIFLTGGSDIEPAVYGEGLAGAEDPFDPERDALEQALVRRAAADKKPLIGICRGSQMLAAALGGRLHQEIAPLTNGELHAPLVHAYEDTIDKPDVPLILEANSRLASLLGASSAQAPCNHHQAIKELPDTLRVAARSAAGIIEAIEAVDPAWFAFGLQSHPETRQGGDFLPLFKAFAAECSKPRL